MFICSLFYVAFVCAGDFLGGSCYFDLVACGYVVCLIRGLLVGCAWRGFVALWVVLV